MERGYQAMLLGGEGSGAYSPAFTSDEACMNALYSAMNAQSFLTVTDEKYLLHSLDYGYGTFPVSPSVDPVSFGFLGEDMLGRQSKEVSQCLANYGDRKMKSVDYVGEKLKIPKIEVVDNVEVSDVSTEPFNFLSESSDSVSRVCDLRFQQLPDLRSLEQVQDGFAFGESSRKRVKWFSPTTTDPRTLESMVRNFQLSDCFTGLKPLDIQAAAVMPQSALARQRRQRISEKTRCLQKLLPWDKKMDMATMLEEAYKYVKFLQAQISVLQSMPCGSSGFAIQNLGNANVFSGLGRLNRHQLLQVVVNSPVVQTILYSQGSCVYSIEQVVLLKKIAERDAIYQQLVYDPSTLP